MSAPINRSLERASSNSGGFNSILLRAVDSALVGAIGDSAAKAIKFYVEVSVITQDPDTFKAQLENVFSGSEAGPKLIEDKIVQTLIALLNQTHAVSVSIEKWQNAKDLRDFINDCRKQFLVS